MRALHDVEAHRGAHLVVAAPGGVKSAGRRADALVQGALDPGVDILVRSGDRQRAFLDLAQHSGEAVEDRFGVLGADDLCFQQHPGMSQARYQIVPDQPGVEGERAGELENLGIEAGGEPAAPQRRASGVRAHRRIAPEALEVGAVVNAPGPASSEPVVGRAVERVPAQGSSRPMPPVPPGR